MSDQGPPTSDDDAPKGQPDPAAAWPFPVGNRDLSDGLLDYRLEGEVAGFRSFIDEVTVIRWLRVAVAVAVMAVLIGLGCALGAVIGAFTRQADKATPEIKHLVDAVKDGPKAAPLETPSGAQASGTPTVKAAVIPASGAASVPVIIAAVDPPPLTAAVKVDIASMAGSIVAVISVLVVAISAIAISLLRATFNLSPHRRDEVKADPKGSEVKDDKKDDGGIPLPTMELMKSLIDCVKAVAGKK